MAEMWRERPDGHHVRATLRYKCVGECVKWALEHNPVPYHLHSSLFVPLSSCFVSLRRAFPPSCIPVIPPFTPLVFCPFHSCPPLIPSILPLELSILPHSLRPSVPTSFELHQPTHMLFAPAVIIAYILSLLPFSCLRLFQPFPILQSCTNIVVLSTLIHL